MLISVELCLAGIRVAGAAERDEGMRGCISRIPEDKVLQASLAPRWLCPQMGGRSWRCLISLLLQLDLHFSTEKLLRQSNLLEDGKTESLANSRQGSYGGCQMVVSWSCWLQIRNCPPVSCLFLHLLCCDLATVSYCIIVCPYIYVMYKYIYIIHLQFYVQYDRLDVNNFLLPCARRLSKPYD